MTIHDHPAHVLPGTVRDGDPHLAYYDRPSSLSFVWTGDPADPIHVQHGGYGEPTIVLLDVADAYPGGLDLTEATTWFRAYCDTWNARWDGDDGALLPATRGRCTHRLEDGPLVCTNTAAHTPGAGCTYASSTGSWQGPHDRAGEHG